MYVCIYVHGYIYIYIWLWHDVGHQTVRCLNALLLMALLCLDSSYCPTTSPANDIFLADSASQQQPQHHHHHHQQQHHHHNQQPKQKQLSCCCCCLLSATQLPPLSPLPPSSLPTYIEKTHIRRFASDVKHNETSFWRQVSHVCLCLIIFFFFG